MVTMPANTVNRAYSWIKAQQHKDEIEAALGTFTAVEILEHRENAQFRIVAASVQPLCQIIVIAPGARNCSGNQGFLGARGRASNVLGITAMATFRAQSDNFVSYLRASGLAEVGCRLAQAGQTNFCASR
jgi:hypothetical protein